MSLRVFTPEGGSLPSAHEAPEGTVRLDANESHYLVRVRRARAGQRLELMDGAGRIAEVELVNGDARAAELEIISVREPPLMAPAVELLLPGLEAKATAVALKHACELGASSVRQLNCRYSQGRFPKEAKVANLWRESMRQCGRVQPPKLEEAVDIGELGAGGPGDFLARRGGGSPRARALTPQRSLRLLIGPEGGLQPEEEERLLDLGWRGLHLGPHLLRAELAVAVGLAKIRASFE